MNNFISQFPDAIRASGLEPPLHIEPGKLHRFPGIGKSNGNKSGYCKMFDDGEGGIFGDWASDFSETWQAKRSAPFSAAEREAFKRHVAESKQQAENVSAVIEALLQLNTALEAEAELRQTLSDEDVWYQQAGIHPMPLNGFQTLANNQGRIFKYLMECYEHGYIKAADLPDVVRDMIPRPSKPEPKQAARPNPDGWLNA